MIQEINNLITDHDLKNIYNMDETGILKYLYNLSYIKGKE